MNKQDQLLWQKVKETVDIVLHPTRHDEYKDPFEGLNMAQLMGDAPVTVTAPAKTEAAQPAQNKKTQTTQPAEGKGVAASQLRKLKRGQSPIDSTLDLHGYSREQAQIIVTRHLQKTFENGGRVVRIITGKGQFTLDGHDGILRQNLPRWLGDAPLSSIVLDHHIARPQHGGAGAFYILLRKKK